MSHWKSILFAFTCAVLLIFGIVRITLSVTPYIVNQQSIVQAINNQDQAIRQLAQRMDALEKNGAAKK